MKVITLEEALVEAFPDRFPSFTGVHQCAQGVCFTPNCRCLYDDTHSCMVTRYYSVENQFERFRGFSSNSNFVVAKIIFFERFEFLVCSKFNHTHHVAVHVACACGLFAPTQFQFECCRVRDDS